MISDGEADPHPAIALSLDILTPLAVVPLARKTRIPRAETAIVPRWIAGTAAAAVTQMTQVSLHADPALPQANHNRSAAVQRAGFLQNACEMTSHRVVRPAKLLS